MAVYYLDFNRFYREHISPAFVPRISHKGEIQLCIQRYYAGSLLANFPAEGRKHVLRLRVRPYVLPEFCLLTCRYFMIRSENSNLKPRRTAIVLTSTQKMLDHERLLSLRIGDLSGRKKNYVIILYNAVLCELTRRYEAKK